jgi:hypothetical protein
MAPKNMVSKTLHRDAEEKINSFTEQEAWTEQQSPLRNYTARQAVVRYEPYGGFLTHNVDEE